MFPSFKSTAVVLALAAGISTVPAQAAGSFNTAFEQDVIDLVNGIRAGAGLSVLGNDARLRNAAIAHSIDMATNGCFSHDSCNATAWSTRIWSYYPGNSGIGENIAAGYTTPVSVVDGWMNSSGHRANILDADWLGIGVGYYYLSGSAYGTYWTQDFGTLAVPVPEADVYVMMLAGMGLVAWLAKRRKA